MFDVEMSILTWFTKLRKKTDLKEVKGGYNERTFRVKSKSSHFSSCLFPFILPSA